MSQLNVDNIQNRTGSNGGPNFPSGITVAVGQTAYIHGNLQVDGTETIINTETLNVADKTVGIGSTSNASNTTADGSGIEIFASSSQTGNNKTLKWLDSTDRWTFTGGDVSANAYYGDGSQLTGIDATAIQTGNTSVQTVDTGSDGHVKMTTEGGERIRIGPAGQIGLGGANYGTSGQVLTSAGSGSAPSWSALPAGGNTFTGIASGSIANNKCVLVCQDGKLAEIKEAISSKAEPTSIASLSSGTGQYFYTNDGNSTNAAINANRGACWVYDPDNDRIVVLWKLGGGSQFYARVGTPNRATGVTTWGDRVMIDNGQLNNPTAVYDTVRNKIVLMGFISNTLRAFVGTVANTGNSSTWTSDYTCPNTDSSEGSNTSTAYDPTTGRTIIVYTDTSANPNGVRMQIGHVDGSGAFVWHTGMTSTNNYLSQDMFTSAPGKVEHFDIQSVGDSKWLFVCTIEASPPSGFADKGIYAKIINAPTSVTATPTYANSGAKHIQTASAVNRGTYPVVAWHPNKEKIVIIYRANTGAGDPGTNDRHYALLCYFNSGKTDITINDAVYGMAGTHTETNSQYQLVYDSGTQSFVYTTNAAAGIVRGHFLSPSGTGNNTLSVSAGGASFNGNGSDFGERSSHTLIDIGTGGISGGGSSLFSIYTWTAVGSSRYVIMPTTAVSTNLTNYVHYVGFANQAYTDGQTVTIKTYGNNVSTLSGLSPSVMYYVQGDGTVATSADSTLWSSPANTPVAGTALNATTLLIRDPRISPNAY